ncbi:MAG: sugar phosphate isomerase/epimerase [Candidatus Methanoperedens sp.]|nr:sugar phosphate isomerase/epimerase [Candidatus Methanoperedens sp.]
MRISCASLFLWEYSVYDIMEILLEAGIKSVEFWAETPLFWMKRNDATSIAELIEALSLMPEGCTLHAPIMDLNPSSYNDHVQEATIKETLWSLDLAQKIGARVVTIHPGKRTVHRTPTDEDWNKFFKYLSVCNKRAEDLDIALMSFIEELSDKIINVHVGSPHNGEPHYPSHRKKNMGTVLRSLRDSGYNSDLTIEIDDKRYSRPLSREDKVMELREERKYLEEIFNETCQPSK